MGFVVDKAVQVLLRLTPFSPVNNIPYSILIYHLGDEQHSLVAAVHKQAAPLT
jgi:hypothetical protein